MPCNVLNTRNNNNTVLTAPDASVNTKVDTRQGDSGAQKVVEGLRSFFHFIV